MQTPAAAADEKLATPQEALKMWFHAPVYGCAFGPRLRLRFLEFGNEPDVSWVNEHIDGAANGGDGAVAFFPEIRSQREVALLIERLRTDGEERWHVLKPKVPNYAEAIVPIGLTYLTRTRHTSAVMGLAPFGSMPVTRRAPYVALALWGGGPRQHHTNREKPLTDRRRVTFADLPINDDPAEEETSWNESVRRSNGLRVKPPEALAIRSVSFALDSSVEHLLDHGNSSTSKD